MRHQSVTRDDRRRLAMWLTVDEPELRDSSNVAIEHGAARGARISGKRRAAGSRHSSDRRFLFAAFAPSFPSAVLVCFGRCATVRFRLAAFAAFLIFRRAADRCFDVAISSRFEIGRHGTLRLNCSRDRCRAIVIAARAIAGSH